MPNKRSIGKQDPYAELSVGDDTQRTRPDKRGGQHPLWDEQLHFEIYDGMQNALAPDGASGHALGIACFALDKESDVIGEGTLALDHVLQHGEHDQWIPLTKNERYAGEVYVELTFYSLDMPKYGTVGQGPPPTTPGTPGSSIRTASPVRVATPVRTTSTSQVLAPRSASGTVPPLLQPGHLAAPPGTYTPPYSHAVHARQDRRVPPVPTRAWTTESVAPTSPSSTARHHSVPCAAPAPATILPPPRRYDQRGVHSPPRVRTPPLRSPNAPQPGAGLPRSDSLPLPAPSAPSTDTAPPSPGAYGLSPIRSPSAPSTLPGSSLAYSASGQWLPPLAADDSAASLPDMLSPWRAPDDSSYEDASLPSRHMLQRPTRAVTTDAEAIEAAAAALMSPHAAELSAHEAIYGRNTSIDTSRPLPSPTTRRPLPTPQKGIDRLASVSLDMPRTATHARASSPLASPLASPHIVPRASSPLPAPPRASSPLPAPPRASSPMTLSPLTIPTSPGGVPARVPSPRSAVRVASPHTPAYASPLAAPPRASTPPPAYAPMLPPRSSPPLPPLPPS